MRSQCVLVLAFLLQSYALPACHAQIIEPIREPPGLEPGDQYRLIFVTSTQRDAL